MVEFFQQVGSFLNMIWNLIIGTFQTVYTLVQTLISAVEVSFNFVGFLPSAIATMVLVVIVASLIFVILDVIF